MSTPAGTHNNSGRSPYPTRSRRRQQQQQQHQQQQHPQPQDVDLMEEDEIELLRDDHHDPRDGSLADEPYNTNGDYHRQSRTQSSNRLVVEPRSTGLGFNVVRSNLEGHVGVATAGGDGASPPTALPMSSSMSRVGTGASSNATITTSSTAAAVSAAVAATVSASGYMMGQGLVQARISPANSINGSGAGNKRRFFGGGTTISSNFSGTNTNRLSGGSGGGGGGSSTIAVAPTAKSNTQVAFSLDTMGGLGTGSTTPVTNLQPIQPLPPLIVDGMDITQLRTLAWHCLGGQSPNVNASGSSVGGTIGAPSSSPSPTMAVFFASMVHAKTQAVEDAFLYARALFGNAKWQQCVAWIERTGLLLCSGAKTHHDDDANINVNNYFALQLESLLLAAQSLANLGDWNSALTLLEDTNHLYCHAAGSTPLSLLMMNVSSSLDDDDEIAWQQLAQSIREYTDGGTSTTPSPSIHPLARICSLRAQAYATLGHPLRAAVFWKKSLRIDPWCVEALDGLLDKGAISPEQAMDVVLDLDYGGSASDWLRALYLARVHVAAPASASNFTATIPPISKTSHNSNDTTIMTARTPAASTSGHYHHHHPPGASRTSFGSVSNVGDPFWHDSSSSSMQMLTPIPQQTSTTVADMSAASTSLFMAATRAAPHSSNGDRSSPEMESGDIGNIGNDNTSTKKNSNKTLEEAETALDTLWNKHQLQRSPEVLAMLAQMAYRKYDLRAALKYCQELAHVDPLTQTTNKAAFCHVATLVALHHKRPLFQLAHQWVEASPKEARAWFAVGAYYYACQRYHVAQRHFCRATRLDPHCAEAWIAFGAAFAACDESDQALASFRAAQRLAPGNHVSLLYIGMEYLRTNHLVLAQHFLQAAHEACSGTDALAKSELGVLFMQQKIYRQAMFWFLQALETVSSTKNEIVVVNSGSGNNPFVSVDTLANLVEGISDDYWEPTLFNLAHVFRKERFMEHAQVCLERCLALKESASAHAALGFCYHLQSILPRPWSGTEDSVEYEKDQNAMLHKAIDTYHQALAKKPDDSFCSEMLQKALAGALEQTNFFLNDDDISDPEQGVDISGGSFQPQTATTLLMNMPKGPQSSLLAGKHVRMRAPASRPSEGSSLRDQSSVWTEDGFSLSVDSAGSDVDMS